MFCVNDILWWGLFIMTTLNVFELVVRFCCAGDLCWFLWYSVKGLGLFVFWFKSGRVLICRFLGLIVGL